MSHPTANNVDRCPCHQKTPQNCTDTGNNLNSAMHCRVWISTYEFSNTFLPLHIILYFLVITQTLNTSFWPRKQVKGLQWRKVALMKRNAKDLLYPTCRRAGDLFAIFGEQKHNKATTRLGTILASWSRPDYGRRFFKWSHLASKIIYHYIGLATVNLKHRFCVGESILGHSTLLLTPWESWERNENKCNLCVTVAKFSNWKPQQTHYSRGHVLF